MVSGLTVFFWFIVFYFLDMWSIFFFLEMLKKHNVFHKMFVFPLNEYYNQLDIFTCIGVLGVLFNQ